MSEDQQALLNSLRESIEALREHEAWKYFKPTSMHANEYFAQARGDLTRCLVNLDRMERVWVDDGQPDA